MESDIPRKLAWLSVTAGLCLIAATVLAQPVANSAAHIERGRVEWKHFAADTSRDWDAVVARIADLPPQPESSVFHATAYPDEAPRIDRSISSKTHVAIKRGSAVVTGESGPIEEIVIRFQVEASWHHMKGEVRIRPAGEYDTSFNPIWRPLILMLVGAGLAFLILGSLAIAMLRREPASG